MQPTTGPVLFSVAGLAGETIANGAELGAPFKWPRALFVTGIQVIPRSGDAADAAALRVRIVDEDQDDVIADGLAENAGDVLAMGGSSFLPFPLQRPVLDGDEWTIVVENHGAAPIEVAAVLLSFDEGLR